MKSWRENIGGHSVTVEEAPEYAPLWRPQAEEIVDVCGRRGRGKTSSGAKPFVRGIPRCIGWDPLDEYRNTLGGPMITIDQLEDRERRGLLYGGVQRMTVRPTYYDEDTIAEEHERFCAVLWRVGNITGLVEEVSLVASPSSVGSEFAQLLAVGRHRAVTLLIVGQRFAQFPRLATSQASRIICYQQSEPNDLRDLGARVGESIPLAAPEGKNKSAPLEEIVRYLPRFYFLDWTPEEGARIRAGRPAME